MPCQRVIAGRWEPHRPATVPSILREHRRLGAGPSDREGTAGLVLADDGAVEHVDVEVLPGQVLRRHGVVLRCVLERIELHLNGVRPATGAELVLVRVGAGWNLNGGTVDDRDLGACNGGRAWVQYIVLETTI